MKESNNRNILWKLFVAELVGTALLVLVGLSLVILMFGTGTPMARLIPSAASWIASARSLWGMVNRLTTVNANRRCCCQIVFRASMSPACASSNNLASFR